MMDHFSIFRSTGCYKFFMLLLTMGYSVFTLEEGYLI